MEISFKTSLMAAIGAVFLFTPLHAAHAKSWKWCPYEMRVSKQKVQDYINVDYKKFINGKYYKDDEFCANSDSINRIVSANSSYNQLMRGEDPTKVMKSSSIGKTMYSQWVSKGKPVQDKFTFPHMSPKDYYQQAKNPYVTWEQYYSSYSQYYSSQNSSQ